jgi:hypothetical protein
MSYIFLASALSGGKTRQATGILAIQGDEYILKFLFAIICAPGLTFTIEL